MIDDEDDDTEWALWDFTDPLKKPEPAPVDEKTKRRTAREARRSTQH